MRILIALASAVEAKHLASVLEELQENELLDIRVCITGPGLMLSAVRLTEAILTIKPDFALQLGVAGAFHPNLEPGTWAAVVSEQIDDIGAEDYPAGFLDLFQLGLMDAGFPEFEQGHLINPLAGGLLKDEFSWVKGLSVNVCTGSRETAARRVSRYRADIESMEGATFHYVCLNKNIPFLQLRGISNLAGPRDKATWDIPAALKPLADWLGQDFSRTLSILQK